MKAQSNRKVQLQFRKHKIAQQVARRLDGRKVTERIKTFDDAIADLGEYDEEVISYKKLLTIFDQHHHIVANQLAVIITKCLNEGWEPDWANNDELKYAPWFEMRGSSGFQFGDDVRWGSRVGSRLCFKTADLARYAGQQFVNVYKQFMLKNEPLK